MFVFVYTGLLGSLELQFFHEFVRVNEIENERILFLKNKVVNKGHSTTKEERRESIEIGGIQYKQVNISLEPERSELEQLKSHLQKLTTSRVIQNVVVPKSLFVEPIEELGSERTQILQQTITQKTTTVPFSLSPDACGVRSSGQKREREEVRSGKSQVNSPMIIGSPQVVVKTTKKYNEYENRYAKMLNGERGLCSKRLVRTFTESS